MRYIFILFSLLVSVKLIAQPTIKPNRTISSDTVKIDSSITDTTKTDSLEKNSKSDLNSEIKYSAEDSIRFSIDGNTIYLFGKGRVSYEDLELDADYIRIDQKNKLLFARGIKDKNGVYRGRPIFKQGTDEPVTTDSLFFNFETKKGKLYGTATSMDGGFIQARQSKKNQYNEVSIKNGIYSTCSLPEPYTHFGIHITKGLITDKQVISGPAYLEIEHIPLPIGLPFGFFPKMNKRASGFRFPSFGEDANRGFYMQGIGWYLGLNDYWDADILGTIYSKGSYDLTTAARYKVNYKYSGSVNLSYSSIRDPNGVEGTPSNSASKQFNVQWTHSQDQSANPGTTLSANVNFGTSSYFQQTGAAGTYDYNSLIKNSMSSSVAYGRTFFDGLFNFTSALRSNQDISAKTVSLTLPQYSLSMTTLNPFDSKDRVGEQKWYQKIAVGYSSEGSNSFNGQETGLFKKENLKKFQNGISHNIPVSLSLNALKVLQFNTSVSYAERWSFQTVHKSLDVSNKIVTDTVQGFARNYNYSFNGGFSTKVYGMKTFKKGNLVALRHVMTPSVNFNYTPDFSDSKYGFYEDITKSTGAALSDSVRRALRYSRFEGTVYGGPGIGRSASIGFSIDNNIEAKVKSKSDTSTAYEKIPIIQGLSFSGNYNFVADSMNLSTISFGGRTAFFKQKIGLNFSGVFDPYQVVNIEGNPIRINKYMFENGKLARLTSFTMSTDFSFNSAAMKKRNDELRQKEDDPNITPSQQQDIRNILNNPNYYVDFTVPWNFSASYSFNYSNAGLRSVITNTLNFNGDLSVTPKWKVQFNSGYDFRAKEISLTRFTINRDLHCWDMSFGWTPFGMYKSYSFDIRVRASILQDLKLKKRSALPLNY
ncbi:putative LPS assembly protein LptD [Arcticibacter eurypsychrophilus]|uniref:putative LPS assembly protein LptD n=1 Tax=Arcticibacter eurypsychrophilus TaxID=1434752 RepID=UPI001FE03449|nr:putative LPS assembly protein LptD [Arcticibacter eurypsychrophilus]